MGKEKAKDDELCPFCGAKFATGIMRGHHVRAVHREQMSYLISDMEQAGFAERRFISEEVS
jgi:hypothetical protein